MGWIIGDPPPEGYHQCCCVVLVSDDDIGLQCSNWARNDEPFCASCEDRHPIETNRSFITQRLPQEARE